MKKTLVNQAQTYRLNDEKKGIWAKVTVTQEEGERPTGRVDLNRPGNPWPIKFTIQTVIEEGTNDERWQVDGSGTLNPSAVAVVDFMNDRLNPTFFAYEISMEVLA